MLPKSKVSYTLAEGGMWFEWPRIYELPTEETISKLPLVSPAVGAIVTSVFSRGLEPPILVHAIRLADGREWDCINGWRNI